MNEEKTIKLSVKEAQKLYKTADSTFKAFLESNFSKKELCYSIMDRIKTWEDVCNELNINNSVLPYRNAKTKKEISINAFTKIQYISEVLNEGWNPNFKNTNEYKYYPCFEYKNSPGEWCFCISYYYLLHGAVCFGFYFKTKELSDYAGKQFLEIYKEYLPE